jgi:hypothetical protein
MQLPSVLTALDLPVTELCAARLDGDLVAVGDAWTGVDTVDDSDVRARSVRGALDGLIADRLTAAWIHGALLFCPRPVQGNLAAGGSHGPDRRTGVDIREAVLAPDELCERGGMPVTTPLRTVVDLLRERVYSPATAETVADLMSTHRLDPALVEQVLLERRFLRERLISTARLAAVREQLNP